MSIEKMIFGKGDTFLTMHEKLKSFIGKEVIGKDISNWIIFSVSDITKEEFPRIPKSASRYFTGYTMYGKFSVDGEFNFAKKQKVWQYSILYGYNKGEFTYTYPFNFIAPRNGFLDKDGAAIYISNNCPFISYEL